MTSRVRWACPKCGATNSSRDPFVCECAEYPQASTASRHEAKDHGESPANPCKRATCYACGWGGTFPPRPKKLPPWARKALDAGWSPPKGWSP